MIEGSTAVAMNSSGTVDPAEVRQLPRISDQQVDHVDGLDLGYLRPVPAGRCRDRIEKAGAEADDGRSEEVRRGHSSGEAGELGGGSPCGTGGAKGQDQRESAKSKHGPSTESGNRDPGDGADTAIRSEETEGETHDAAARVRGRTTGRPGVLQRPQEIRRAVRFHRT